MGVELNGDKKWLAERLDNIDNQFKEVKEDINKLYQIYEKESDAHVQCREEWVGQISFLKGVMKLNKDEAEAKDKAKTEHRDLKQLEYQKEVKKSEYRYYIVAILSSIITGIIVVLSRGIYSG